MRYPHRISSLVTPDDLGVTYGHSSQTDASQPQPSPSIFATTRPTSACLQTARPLCGVMILQVLHCPRCYGTSIVRHGQTRQGKQRYRCREQPCAGGTFLLNCPYIGQWEGPGGSGPGVGARRVPGQGPEPDLVANAVARTMHGQL